MRVLNWSRWSKPESPPLVKPRSHRAWKLRAFNVEARDAISILAAYNFIYYAVARRALKLMVRESEGPNATLKTGMSTSVKLISMIFNRELPREDQSRQFKVVLRTSRVMLYAAPLVFVLVFLLL